MRINDKALDAAIQELKEKIVETQYRKEDGKGTLLSLPVYYSTAVTALNAVEFVKFLCLPREAECCLEVYDEAARGFKVYAFKCSACGSIVEQASPENVFNYCPICGKKIDRKGCKVSRDEHKTSKDER